MALLKYWDRTSQSYQPVGLRGLTGVTGPQGPPGPDVLQVASGSWFCPLPVVSNGTATWVANSIRITRLRLTQPVNMAQVELTTSQSGSFQIATWTDVNNGPGTLVDQSGAVSTTTTGIKTVAVNIPAGICWVGLFCTAATTSFRASAAANSLSPGVDMASVSPGTSIFNAWQQTGLTVSAMPATFPLAGITRSATFPLMYLRTA
jgi:hypothetical protein